MSPVKPIPEDYHTVTPYILVQDAAKLIDFVRLSKRLAETILF